MITTLLLTHHWSDPLGTNNPVPDNNSNLALICQQIRPGWPDANPSFGRIHEVSSDPYFTSSATTYVQPEQPPWHQPQISLVKALKEALQLRESHTLTPAPSGIRGGFQFTPEILHQKNSTEKTKRGIRRKNGLPVPFLLHTAASAFVTREISPPKVQHGYTPSVKLASATRFSQTSYMRAFETGDTVMIAADEPPETERLLSLWRAWAERPLPDPPGLHVPTYGALMASGDDQGFLRWRAHMGQFFNRGERISINIALDDGLPDQRDLRQNQDRIADVLNRSLNHALHQQIRFGDIRKITVKRDSSEFFYYRADVSIVPDKAIHCAAFNGLLKALNEEGTSAFSEATVHQWYDFSTAEQPFNLRGIIAMRPNAEITALRVMSSLPMADVNKLLREFCLTLTKDSNDEYRKLRLSFATFNDYVPESRCLLRQIYTADQALLSSLLSHVAAQYPGQIGLPPNFNSDPRSALPISTMALTAELAIIGPLKTGSDKIAAYDEMANWSNLPEKVIRYPNRTRGGDNIGGSHCFSFPYGGPATPWVKSCLAIMLVTYFTSINAPDFYLDVAFWLPIILVRATAEREIIRIFIAFTPGFMAANIFNALFNKCLADVDTNTPMRLAIGRCRCRSCFPNCNSCGKSGHFGNACPTRQAWKSWFEHTYICCFCGILSGGTTGHNFLHCRKVIEISDPRTTRGCSLCGHYSHDFMTCPTGKNPDGTYTPFTALLAELAKHDGWQLISGDLTARKISPQHDLLSVADTVTFPVTPERALSTGSNSSPALSSQSSAVSTSAIRDIVMEALTPIQASIGLLQQGFTQVAYNVNVISSQVDTHQAFLVALQQSGQLQATLQTRSQAALPPPPPVEEPMPPGADE